MNFPYFFDAHIKIIPSNPEKKRLMRFFMIIIVECLKKTSPPVLIFAERKQDVDIIHEYLLLKVITFFLSRA